MTRLTPEAGSKLLAISICMPQHNTNQGNQTYKEALQWLTKTLTEHMPYAAVMRGGTSKLHPRSATPHITPLMHFHQPQIPRRPLHTYLHTH